MSYHGQSGRLRNITTNEIVWVKSSGLKERCHVDDLLVFVPRKTQQMDANAIDMQDLRGSRLLGHSGKLVSWDYSVARAKTISRDYNI